jgi:hypothetical protein
VWTIEKRSSGSCPGFHPPGCPEGAWATPRERPRSSTPRIAAAALAAVVATACDFVDAASELTAGEGEVPRITASVSFPSVGRFVASRPGGEAVGGVTASLDRATLAHLAGLLRLDGTCTLDAALEPPGPPVVDLKARIVLCDPGRTCDGLCPEGFTGALVDLATTVNVLDEQGAGSLSGQLDRVSDDAIVQIRMRVHELRLEGRGPDAASPRDLMPLLSAFEFQVATTASPPVTLVGAEHLEEFAGGAARRFELPSRAPLTAEIEGHLLSAEPFDLEFRFRFAFPSSALFGVTPGTARWRFDVQPEFVLSVLEAVEGG